MRLTFLLYNGKAVPISLFRRTKGSADHVFQRGNDFHQESDVRQNSCMCHKSQHFGRPSEGILSSHGLKMIKIHFIPGTKIILCMYVVKSFRLFDVSVISFFRSFDLSYY